MTDMNLQRFRYQSSARRDPAAFNATMTGGDSPPVIWEHEVVPTPLTVVIIATVLGLMGLLIAGIAYAAMTQRGSTPGIGPARIVGVSATILLGWVGLLFVLAARGAFAATPEPSVPVIAFGIGIPIILGLWCLAASGLVRTLVEAIPLHWLIGVQVYRIPLGASFLFAYLWHIMPAEFALHAGIGDVLLGLMAPLVAYAVMKSVRSARVLARSWNILGIADLTLAVTLGFLTSPSPIQQLAFSCPIRRSPGTRSCSSQPLSSPCRFCSTPPRCGG